MTGTEIEITADPVRDLLQEQHPDLAGLAVREVAGGWGSSASARLTWRSTTSASQLSGSASAIRCRGSRQGVPVGPGQVGRASI
jgi:hypothetical protein